MGKKGKGSKKKDDEKKKKKTKKKDDKILEIMPLPGCSDQRQLHRRSAVSRECG